MTTETISSQATRRYRVAYNKARFEKLPVPAAQARARYEMNRWLVKAYPGVTGTFDPDKRTFTQDTCATCHRLATRQWTYGPSCEYCAEFPMSPLECAQALINLGKKNLAENA